MIIFKINGDEDTQKMLRQSYPAVQEQVSRSITRLTLQLLTRVKEEKLSGQVLKNRTGRLRRSINSRFDTASGGKVAGYVGTNVEYAKIHELGFNGNMTVKAHLRQITQAFGKKLLSPKMVEVRSHSRHVNLPERSFLRSALKEMEPDVREQLLSAVRLGVRR